MGYVKNFNEININYKADKLQMGSQWCVVNI